MKKFQRFCLISLGIGLASLVFLSEPSKATTQIVHHEIKILFLTPIDLPEYWNPGASNKVQDALDQAKAATDMWSRTSNMKLDFSISYQISAPLKNLQRCNVNSDWLLAQAQTGFKPKNNLSHLLVINPESTCAFGGYAQVRGSFISLKVLDSVTIAHELGHNLGFQHSGLVICPKGNFQTINGSCEINQYGDKTDVMGSGLVFDQAKMSLAQSSLVWGYPIAIQVKPGKQFKYLVAPQLAKPSNSLYKYSSPEGMLWIEYDDATQNGGLRVSPSDQPGIEIRISNNALAKKFSSGSESGIGTLALGRYVGLDADGSCGATCHFDLRFHPGEVVRIPGAKPSIHIFGSPSGDIGISIY
jgi:hypothetical protein